MYSMPTMHQMLPIYYHLEQLVFLHLIDESLYWVLDEGVLLYHLFLAQLFVIP